MLGVSGYEEWGMRGKHAQRMSRYEGTNCVCMYVCIYVCMYVCSHYLADLSFPFFFPLPFSLRALPLLERHSKPATIPQQPHPLLQLRPPLPLLRDKRRGHSGTDHTVNDPQQSKTGQWQRPARSKQGDGVNYYTVL